MLIAGNIHATGEVMVDIGDTSISYTDAGFKTFDNQFIFESLLKDDKRRLILTSNNGTRIKGTKLPAEDPAWMDVDSWSAKPALEFENFHGEKSGMESFHSVLSSKIEQRYQKVINAFLRYNSSFTYESSYDNSILIFKISLV